jgi:hypothetical protein
MLKNFKLLNLKLANAGLIIKQVIKDNLSVLLTVTSQIKKAFRVIYQYHINKKRIIFIGNPLYINKQLALMLKKTKHVFIPQSAWVAGHIAERFTRPTKMAHKKSKIKLFSLRALKKKSNLVVIANQYEDSIALNEHHSAKIPIITLNNVTGMLDETSEYKVSAQLAYIRSEISELLFYSLLLAVFKKANSKKNKLYSKKSKTHKLRVASILKGPYRKKWKKKTL